MESMDLIVMVLPAAAIVYALYLCLSDLLPLLGIGGIRRGIDGGPDAIPRHQGDGDLDDLCSQLEELGFEPAGVYWEQGQAHKRFREYAFASKTGDCFATIYQLFANDAPRTAFLSTFEDGAAILTQNYAGGMNMEFDDIRVGPPGAELEEDDRLPLEDVLIEHRRRASRFGLQGRKAVPARTIDDFLEAERVYEEHPAVTGEMLSINRFMLFSKLVYFAAIPSAVAYWCGGLHPAVWIVLVLQCVVVSFFRTYLVFNPSCDAEGG